MGRKHLTSASQNYLNLKKQTSFKILLYRRRHKLRQLTQMTVYEMQL